MTLEPLEFVVGEAAAGRRIGRRLLEAFPARERKPAVERSVYYDTWDWRIRRAGGALGLNGSSRRGVLTWTPGSGRRPLRASVPAPPAFRRDLPAGAMAAELGEVLDVRRLLPRVELRRRRRVYDILDSREKTVARAELREPEARRAADPAEAQPRGERTWSHGRAVLRLEPIRGYEPAFQRLRRFVEFELRLAPRETSDVEEALALVGLATDPGPSLESVRLDPRAPAAASARELFGVLFGSLEAQVEGTRADLDTEFLHDLRVAVRRTRSLLQEVRGVLPEPALRHYAREFRWLGRLTGPCRDLDVLELRLPSYVGGLDEDSAEAFRAVGERVAALRAAEQRRVAAGLASKRFATLARNWTDFLAGGDASVHLPRAEEPTRALARRVVRKRARKLLAGCAEVGPESPVERLHALRIRGKRLRYALELLGSLFEPELLGRAVRRLKRLQNALGDLNDLAVHSGLLEEAAERVPAERRPAALLATGRVLERLRLASEEQRELALRRAGRLTEKDARRRFRRLVEELRER